MVNIFLNFKLNIYLEKPRFKKEKKIINTLKKAITVEIK